MIGGILAYVIAHKASWEPSLRTRNISSITGLLLVVLSVVVLTKASRFPGWWALLPTLGTFLLISAGPNAWVNKNILGSRALVSIGLISYPLYLWHWPALYIANQLSPDSAMQIRLFRVAAVGASFVLAYLTFRWIEKPIRNRSSGKTISILVGAITAIALIGFFVFASGGIKSRYPKLLQTIGEVPIQAEWREHECFLQPGDSFNDKCAGSKTKPSLLLWGDSHAAALYPGFRELEKSNIGVAQYTISACAPLIQWESPSGKFCAQSNEHVLQMISKLKPDSVLLHANWSSTTNSKYDLNKLSVTVQRIKEIGVPTQIYLVGPAPQYLGDLPKNLWKCYGANAIPEYSECGLSKSIEELDLMLNKMARGLNIQYISIYKEMCGEHGCLVRIGDDITTTDYGHLTPSAARFVVKSIGGKLLINHTTSTEK